MRKLLLLSAVFVAISANALADKKVGLFKDSKSYITDGMEMTLRDAGYRTEIITREDVQKGDKLNDLDVVFLPGGWNALNFVNFTGRKNLIDFVAQGKGILAGAFRSGYCRTNNRPLFPQIGAVYNRISGSTVYPEGDSALVAGIDKPFFLSSYDHMVAKVGNTGKVFLVDSDGLPVGVSGELYSGRYAIIGAFIGFEAKTAPMEGPEKTLFLNCVKWLASAPKLSEAQTSETRKAAELEFLRREKIYDYTLNERGPDAGPGVIVRRKDALEVPLAARKYRLEYYSEYLVGEDRSAVIAEIAALDRAINTLDRNYREILSRKLNEISAMSREDLIADNPFLNKDEVLRKIDTATGKDEKGKQNIKSVIAGMENNVWFDDAPKKVAAFLYKDSVDTALVRSVELEQNLADADALLTKVGSAVKAGKAAKLMEERVKDQTKVPVLIEQCSARDAAVRREAAMELGRIGDQLAVATLIRLLDDEDGKARTNAILALGWLQAKDAVPKLIDTAKNQDVRFRRRAVQALGQIGDKSAVPALLAAMKDADYHVRENAVLALGWLKAEEAVPAMIEILTLFDRQDPYQRGLMIAAIRALGHIGDGRALPRLEFWVTNANDFPAPRRAAGKRITNIYSTGQSLGLQGHAELAVAEIAAGGREAVGVSQNERLASPDKFYGLTRNFNFFIGRPFGIMNSNFSDNPSEVLDYMYSVGATGIHNAWGRQDDDPEAFLEILRKADAYNLRWLDVMPMDGNQFGAKEPYKLHRQDRTLDKAGAEVTLLKVADIPSFQGFWTEEDYPDVEMTSSEFEKILTEKHGSDFRKKLDVEENVKELLPPLGKRLKENFASGKLYAEFLELSGERLLDQWVEAQEWLHGFRKGCAFTFNNTVGVRFTYPGVCGKAGGIIDGHGPESYQSFGSDNAFMMELTKDGEARPTLCEFYNWYCPSPEHAARGFAQHLVHGECFFNFSLDQIFGQAGETMWAWDGRRWDKAADIFRKARKVKDYLAIPMSNANVALVASERSDLLFYPKGYGERVPLSRRYYQNQSGLWSALQQSHTPADAIWTETMTAEKLRRYKVLVLSDAKSLTFGESDLIRKWVRDGGVLIAGGTTSLFDQWGVKLKDYALADVFGVNYAGHAAVTDPKKSDTYCFDVGKTTFKTLNEGLDPEKFRYHVHRDLKPVQSIGTYSVTDNTVLPGLAKGFICEYDMPLGHDQITLSGAKILASFAEGVPALTVNKYGKGLCYFWTPIYPGLCHVASGWELEANFKDFWPGVRELLEAMVRGGLETVNAALPVEVYACPKNVEIVIRKQPDKQRWMIHLLNIDPNLSRVTGVGMIVRTPSSEKLKVFYPDTGTAISYVRTADGIVISPRPFEVHDMIVIEY